MTPTAKVLKSDDTDIVSSAPAPMAWEIPPATSHLYGWFLEDDAGQLLRNRLAHGGKLLTGLATRAVLTIAFNVSESDRSIGSRYEYYFVDREEALTVIAKLRAAAEPGKVVWELRRAGLPYRKIG